MSAKVSISMGDPSGIGPEVTVQALRSIGDLRLVPYVHGDGPILERLARRYGLKLPLIGPSDPLPIGGALVAVTRLPAADARPGRPAPAGGAAQLAYLDAAFRRVEDGEADALCTAPVSKAQIGLVLPGFVGHTEWLEARTRTKRSVMLLAGERLKVALVTNHLALAQVRPAITSRRILDTIEITDEALRRDLGLRSPRIAVCALNPHAGDQGAFGDEDARVVAPAIEKAKQGGAEVFGPFPSDSLFFRAATGEFDAVVAMYHDQGLIPIKLLDVLLGDSAVNVTLGLPYVRTSPDHGTAYDLAGKGRANPKSMETALRLAVSIANRRRKGSTSPGTVKRKRAR